MNTSSASPNDRAETAPSAPSRRTMDAASRAFHWLLALCFTGAYFTAEGERWRLVHVSLGYTMVGLMVFRLLWGLMGPRHARLSQWLHRLKGVPTFMRAAQEGKVQAVMAQSVLSAMAVLALMALVVLTTASGYVSYEELAGDWMEDVHETMGNALLVVVLTHVGLLLAISVWRGRNLLMPMVTGKTPGQGADLIKRNHAGLAALLLVAVMVFWVYQWQQAPVGAQVGQQAGHNDDDDDD